MKLALGAVAWVTIMLYYVGQAVSTVGQHVLVGVK